MITFDKSTQTFYLEGGANTYAMRVANGRLEHLYYGERIGRDDLAALLPYVPRTYATCPPPYDGAYCLDTVMQEFPAYGAGDYRTPYVAAEYAGGAALDFTYCSHEIVKKKPQPEGLPALRGEETLKVTLKDDAAHLTAELFYTVYPEGAVARRVEVTNVGGASVRLGRCMSGGLELPEGGYELVTITGYHLTEGQLSRVKLANGIFSLSSTRGASSHTRNPFAALVTPDTAEESGPAYGVQLVYSGSFLIEAEQDPLGNTRVAAGVHPLYGATELLPGERWASPELVLCYSERGLGGLSRALHDLYRARLLPEKFAYAPRPVVLNSWESLYFELNEEKLCALIRSAKGLGADLFVLDDGWFGHRDNDLSSLGDWTVDKRKFPKGLAGVISCCKENGMRFGLWFEPEMVSEDSALFTAHPDWAISSAGRKPTLGRHQRVLDFSRKEVVDYAFESVSSVLKAYDISYIKWDMNRNITDAPQFSLHDKYIRGVYALYERLNKAFPDVLIEGCAGGGGRFDAGILRYSPQVWTSDNSDAYSRCRVQYGMSLCYPLSAMSNHVSVCPNHQTGRVTPLKTRTAVASLGAYGYELNPFLLTDAEREEIAAATREFQDVEALVQGGDLYRLKSPFSGDSFCMEVAAKDASRAYVVYVKGHNHGNEQAERLRLLGLDPKARYRVRELNATFTGETLAGVGLPVLPPARDFEAVCFHVERVK